MSIKVAALSCLADRQPVHVPVERIDLVVIRFGDQVAVPCGRCLHRGALIADGYVDARVNPIFGVHPWDYRLGTGLPDYRNSEALLMFAALVEGGDVLVDAEGIAASARAHPQPFKRGVYLGRYQDAGHGGLEEPHAALLQPPSRKGLSKVGHHSAVKAMAVALGRLPDW